MRKAKGLTQLLNKCLLFCLQHLAFCFFHFVIYRSLVTEYFAETSHIFTRKSGMHLAILLQTEFILFNIQAPNPGAFLV